jgi:HEAT repeat protein
MMKDRDRIDDDACNWIEIPKYPDGHWEADMASRKTKAFGAAVAAGAAITLFVFALHQGLFDRREKPPAEQEPSYQGKPTRYWREKLRAQAADPFKLHPVFANEDPAAIPVLAQLVRDEDTTIRRIAAVSLSTMGRELDDVVPTLVKVLKDPDPIVRSYAALALAKADPVKHDTVPLLAAALDDTEVCVRISAAEALGTLGPKATAATGALEHALGDEDSYVRVKSAEALYKIDRRVDVVVPILVRGLKDENSTRRRGAAEALTGMGPDAKAAVNALTEALADDDLRFAATQALGAIGPGPKPATPALLKIVSERRSAGKPFWWARDALMKIDPQAVALAGVPEDR